MDISYNNLLIYFKFQILHCFKTHKPKCICEETEDILHRHFTVLMNVLVMMFCEFPYFSPPKKKKILKKIISLNNFLRIK